MVATGDATAAANVVDMANQTFIGSDNFYMLIRVHGDWTGDIFGLPEGISWTQTDAGIQLFSTPGQSTTPSTLSDEILNVTNNNIASIINNIDVFALTGDNRATGGEGAFIGTGNAFASANIFNIVNTTVIGQNWALGIFNIFGNWNGNLVFGRPDLWIGAEAMHYGPSVGPSGDIYYTFTVRNNGDSRAENVFLRLHNPFNRMSFTNPDRLFSDGTLDTGWSLGTIEAGETKTFEVSGRLASTLPLGESPIDLIATVSSNQDDANEDDNTEQITVVAQNNEGSNGGVPIIMQPDSSLEITKEASVSEIQAGETIDYTITVRNLNGGPAYHSLLIDTITDEHGAVVNEEYWDLGRIAPDEEISVTYSVRFTEDTDPGMYRNHAQLLAVDRHASINPFFGRRADTDVVTTEVRVNGYVPPVDAASLFAFTDRCEQYLFAYMRIGADNDAGEVMKLQRFLRDFEGFDVQDTGVFDSETEAAVKAFQRRYADDILNPWGIEDETGYVYYTTRKKINEIWCGHERDFGLTLEQLEEIALFKRRLELLRLHNQPLPDTNVVGEREEAFQDFIASDEPDLEVAVVTEEERLGASDIVDLPDDPTPSLGNIASPAAAREGRNFFRGLFRGVSNILLQVRVQDGDVTLRNEDKRS